jgi:hypothetical protein
MERGAQTDQYRVGSWVRGHVPAHARRSGAPASGARVPR